MAPDIARTFLIQNIKKRNIRRIINPKMRFFLIYTSYQLKQIHIFAIRIKYIQNGQEDVNQFYNRQLSVIQR